MQDFPNDCMVIVSKESGTSFLGRVVGIAQIEQPVIGKTMMIECLDGTIPNDTYPYRVIATPEIFLQRL